MSRARVWLPRLARFVARGMVRALREPQNEAKSDWRQLGPDRMSNAELLGEWLNGEAVELAGALQRVKTLRERAMLASFPINYPVALASAKAEAADVANLAMMVWDSLDQMERAWEAE